MFVGGTTGILRRSHGEDDGLDRVKESPIRKWSRLVLIKRY